MLRNLSIFIKLLYVINSYNYNIHATSCDPDYIIMVPGQLYIYYNNEIIHT